MIQVICKSKADADRLLGDLEFWYHYDSYGAGMGWDRTGDVFTIKNYNKGIVSAIRKNGRQIQTQKYVDI